MRRAASAASASTCASRARASWRWRCARARDVVAENYRGGVLRDWGLDYEPRAPAAARTSSISPRRASVPAVRSPRRRRSARSTPPSPARNWLWNFPDAPYPAGTSLNHPDHVASKLATVAVLAALEHRRRTGEGQYIEMAQTEAAAFLIGEFYLRARLHRHGGRVRRATRSTYAAPHGVYPCAGDDQWVRHRRGRRRRLAPLRALPRLE